MPHGHRRPPDDEFDDERDEYDADDFDSDDFDHDTVGVIDCPYCGEEITHDSPRCPYCENYLSQEDAPPTRKPAWIVLAALLALLGMFLASGLLLLLR